MKRKYSSLIFSVIVVVLMSSCGSVKYPEMLMFETVQTELSVIDTLPVLVIQPDDILSIKVASRKPENVVAFQLEKESQGATGENALGVLDGYRVDEVGNIYLPFLGEVKAAGKTVSSLRSELVEKLIRFIPDASVQVRFMNFRITLLGEVTRPNAYTIPNERLTILEALGMAGDFTPYAKRNSVLIIRERNEVREFIRLNTQDKALFKSPYFYLQPNDIVYVEPLKAKQYATQGDFISRYSNVFFPVVTLLTFLLGTRL
ncbi:MAG: polysaccharide biosynthesis/export family protein [Saprospiraceae bacterium]